MSRGSTATKTRKEDEAPYIKELMAHRRKVGERKVTMAGSPPKAFEVDNRDDICYVSWVAWVQTGNMEAAARESLLVQLP